MRRVPHAVRAAPADVSRDASLSNLLWPFGRTRAAFSLAWRALRWAALRAARPASFRARWSACLSSEPVARCCGWRARIVSRWARRAATSMAGSVPTALNRRYPPSAASSLEALFARRTHFRVSGEGPRFNAAAHPLFLLLCGRISVPSRGITAAVVLLPSPVPCRRLSGDLLLLVSLSLDCGRSASM